MICNRRLKGFSLSLVKELLNNGYRVAATSRNTGDLDKKIGSNANFLPLDVEITNEASVRDSIAKTLKKFGTIDVVVNNAGYGQLGTLEETTDAEARENFDVNVFGTLNVIRSVMSHLREKKSGRIINISSIAGFLGGFPGWVIYNATKFAVAGLTEALVAETKSHGVTAQLCILATSRPTF